MTTLISLLQERAARSTHQLAYLFLADGKEETDLLTLGELDAKSRNIAAFLQKHFLCGERIILFYPPGLEFITAFVGCLYAGMVPVPLHCPHVAEFEKSIEWMNAVIENAEITGILSTLSHVEKLKEQFTDQDKYIIFDTASMHSEVNSYQVPYLTPESIAFLQYSSGSTSTPKAVVIKHKHLLHNLKCSAQAWHYSSKSISLSWAPHSHIFGLVCGILVPLYFGAPAILMPPEAFVRKPSHWLEAISKYRVTHSGCPNFGYDLCVKEIKDEVLSQLNLKSWQSAINGGEKVQHDTLIQFADKFATAGFNPKSFCSAFGMSEMSGTIAVSRFGKGPMQFNLDPERLEAGEVVFARKGAPFNTFMGNGNLISGLEAEIIDPETLALLGKDKIGEICLTGACLTEGYWGLPEENAHAFITLPHSNKTYFRTGDLGFIHKNEICITGRLKELIIYYGKKYYPADLELTAKKALQNKLIGQSHLIFSLAAENKEQIIFLQEVPEEITSEQQDEIHYSIRAAIMKEHGIDIHDIIFVKDRSLPRTTSGKLQRKQSKQAYLEETLEIINKKNESPTLTIENEKISSIVKLVASVLKLSPEEIHLYAPISQYHLDSISVTKLITAINEAYQFTLSPAVLFEYSTLGNFIHSLIDKTYSHQKIKSYETIPLDSRNEIAIIGVSGIFPGAGDIHHFWDNLIAGKDAISEIPEDRWDAETYSTIKWGGFIKEAYEFDAAFFNISPREAELTDPQQRLFLQAVWKAIEDAGYTTQTFSNLITGLFVGVFNNDYSELLQKNQINDAYITTGTTHSILANRVSYLLDFHGPSEAIDTACSSSLVALHHAVQAIKNGDCQVAIAGGVNALLSPSPFIIANKAGMLSPEGRCKTFDKNANGYVRGEGVGALVLKPLQQALKDNDHIYGVIKGTAVNHGGLVSSLTVPNPTAQADVIISACRRAHINADTISYVETHGTGTSLGDPIEINGLKKAFEQLREESPAKNSRCGLGSLKTHIGHLEAAAGIAGVIKVLMALKHKQLPGNLHLNEVNPYIDLTGSPFYLLDKNQAWESAFPRRAGVSSFGFGGTNAHLILEEAPEQIHSYEESSTQLITLSAKSDSALMQRIADLDEWLKRDTPSLSNLSYTLNCGRNHFAKRCVFVIDSIEELKKTLQQVKQHEQPNNFIINLDARDTQKTRHLFNELFKWLKADLAHPEKLTKETLRNKLLALGNFYTEGYDLDWHELHRGSQQRISLPTYPFAKENYRLPKIEEKPKALLKPSIKTDLLSQIQSNLIEEASLLLKMPSSSVPVNVALNDLGFNSITFKEFAERLENRYHITVSPAVFYTYQTIEALSRYLLENHKEKFSLPEEESIASSHFNSAKKEIVEPIAIVGVQAYLPQSNNLQEFWDHLTAGDDLVSEVPIERWDWRTTYGDSKSDYSKTNSKWGAFISDVDKFDAGFFNISAREANLMDPQHRLFMEIVWKTIEDAGIDPLSLSGKPIGLFAGIEFNEYQTLLHASQKNFHGHLATGTSHALLANRISYFLNFQGPSEVVDTACSSSLVAIHRAVNSIRHGECDMAIAGGVSLMLNPDTFVITSQMGALSADGRCKTFDKSANGYVKGEGIAAILLKPLSLAKKDGNPIYGLIKGTAVNHGGKAQSLTAPNAATQSQLLIKAYSEANIDIETVTYIEPHGTGTELGDPIEVEGLKQAFQFLQKKQHTSAQKKYFCGLSSVKTNIGHLEPASGVVGLIKVLLALQHGKIPGNLHFKELNPYIHLADSPFYIIEKTSSWSRLKDEAGNEIPRRAGVSSFGFGGTCAHIVVEENIPPSMPIHSLHKSYYLITLSAKQSESLHQKINDLYVWLKQHFSTVNLEALSVTLNQGRTHFTERCAIVVNSLEELLDSLQLLKEKQVPTNVVMGHSLNSENPLHHEIYQHVLATIKNYADTPAHLYREKLLILGDLYTKNYPIEWQILHAGEKNQRISSLPTYPFIKQRYWFDAEKPAEVFHPTPVMQNAEEYALNYLKDIFAEKLQINASQIDVNATYEIYGVDSLIGLEITNRLEKDLGPVSKTLLYEKNNLHDLAIYVQQKHHATLSKLMGQETLISTAFSSLPSQVVTHSSSVESNDIAIIGISGRFPLAENLKEFWDNLCSSRDCITTIPSDRWNAEDLSITVGQDEKLFRFGGFLPDVDKFDPLFFGIAPREASLMDPQERLFLESAWATLEDAGYNREKLQQRANNEVGVFAGVTYNFYPLFIQEEWQKGNQLPLDIQLFSVANRVSYFLNLKGPSFVVDTACSSSLAAIHLACESILRGECKMALAGGVNLSLHPSKYHFLGSYGFLSEEGRCASFAEGGSGYIPGEGVGTLLLKPLAQAKKDNDRIIGIIKSSAMNHGGKTSGYTVPNPNAQGDLIHSALKKAAMDPRTISYVEAHGTGTALGDPIEIRGLQQAYELYTEDKQFCAIGSVKSNIGHLESAAGISQVAKVLLQMKYQTLVPSLHSEKLNPFIQFEETPFFVQRELSEWKTMNHQPRRAGVSSFGAGGTNVHLILEEFIPAPSVFNIQKPFIFLLSATNNERLQAYIEKFIFYLSSEKNQYASADEKDKWLTCVCYTLQTGREAMSAKLAILADNDEDLVSKLKIALNNMQVSHPEIWISAQAKTSISSEQMEIALTHRDYPKLAEYWTQGCKIKWETLYSESLPKMELPTYPFAKRRCWVTPEVTVPIKPISSETETALASQDWLYSLQWENQDAEMMFKTNDINDHWLIFSDNELGFVLGDKLNRASAIYCFSGDEFKRESENVFYINSSRYEDYVRLFAELHQEKNKQLKGIIFLWNENRLNENDSLNYSDLYENSQRFSYGMVSLLKALTQQQWQNPLLLSFVARNSQFVLQQDKTELWQHHLWSLIRVFAAEQGNYQVLLLDLDKNKSLQEEAEFIKNELLNFNPNENHLAMRNKERYVIRLMPYSMPPALPQIHFPDTVLITGGLGALGSEVVRSLAKKGTQRFLLIGTTSLPERSTWQQIQEKGLQEKIKCMEELEKLNIDIRYYAADVTDKTRLQQCIHDAEQQWQKSIDGVFHLAGITTDSVSIDTLSNELLDQVLSVKMKGALVLHDLFQQAQLKCFVLFSSIAALPFFGMRGLSAYAMANEFLNGLANFRRTRGLPAMSINWAAWSEKGMSFKYDHGHFLEAVGMSTISPVQGGEILNELLALQPGLVTVFKVNWSKFFTVNTTAKKLGLFSHVVPKQTHSTKENSHFISLTPEQISEKVITALASVLQLSMNEIDLDAPYSSYGLDSIIGIQFVAKLGEDFPETVSPMDLYRYPSVKLLTEYISKSQKNTAYSEEIITDILSEDEIRKLIEEEIATI